MLGLIKGKVGHGPNYGKKGVKEVKQNLIRLMQSLKFTHLKSKTLGTKFSVCMRLDYWIDMMKWKNKKMKRQLNSSVWNQNGIGGSFPNPNKRKGFPILVCFPLPHDLGE